MFDSLKKYHVIHNFPKGYPLHKKLFANFIYFITGIIVHKRKNLLNHQDLLMARIILKKGDIALWGNLRETSSLFIHGALTHASLYIGNKKFVEAIGDGVTYNSLHHFFTEYDTLVILRLPRFVNNRRKKIKLAVEHAEKQVGKPYDFGFSRGADKFFCTELVNYAYSRAKHHTGLTTIGGFKEAEKSLIQKLIPASRALSPIKMAEEGNFETVFMSHNIGMKNKLYLKSRR